MKIANVPPRAALVIKWPQAASPAAARETARRLAAGRTPATWSLDQASQVQSLASWGALRDMSEAALIVPTATGATTASDNAAAGEVSRRLELLRFAGVNVDLVHGGAELSQNHWPRTLRALGIHGVVVDAAPAASARALPFGVWLFTPDAIVPRVRRWTDWLSRRQPLFAGKKATPVMATIDLARVGAPGSRSWREMELAVEQAAEARSAGTITLAPMGELTAQFVQSGTARPQRSILRAA